MSRPAAIEEPVFVCGLGRSGTTWIARTLAQSPELVYVGEAWLIEKLDELVRWHGVLHDEWGEFTTWRRSGITRQSFLGSLARFYAELLRTASDGRRFIEKTPEWNVFHLGLLAELFPRARMILLYRDGRNYVASTEAKKLAADEEFDFRDACRKWARAMDVFEEIRGGGAPGNMKLVRYEDLLTRFTETFAELCDFVEIPPIAVRPLPPNSSFPNHRDAGDFNTRWHGWSKQRKAVFRSHAGEQLRRWGYTESVDGW